MAATSGKVYPWDGKMYRNSAGISEANHATPTWAEIKNVQDVEATDSMEFKELDLRSNAGFKAGVPGFRSLSWKFKMLYNLADAQQTALRTAYDARVPIEFAMMDQAIATAGSTGPRGVYYVTEFKRDEKETPMMIDVELKPAADATQPPDRFTAS